MNTITDRLGGISKELCGQLRPELRDRVHARRSQADEVMRLMYKLLSAFECVVVFFLTPRKGSSTAGTRLHSEPG